MIAALVLSSELLRAGAASDGAPPASAEEVRMHLSRDEESIRGALAAFTDAVNRGDYGAVLGMIRNDETPTPTAS